MAEVRIGKTVIETLTSGMYEDSRFIYREYIQNSADQIDRAVELGIFTSREEGQIHVTIDNNHKRIIIEDNATGIKSSEFFSTLADIALSSKDRTKRKGFRGIGRLGGLGYCSKLIFETSYIGENVKSIMTWDADNLQRKLQDHELNLDASSIVESVIEVAQTSCDENSHFFKVILENTSNSELLNRNNIEEYLSMVAPVPFPSHFIFKKLIHEELKKDELTIDEYCVFINTDRLYKGYTTAFYENGSSKKYDEIFDVEFIKITNPNKELIAWGWYGISKFDKQIPVNGNISRGIRLRKGNIQIGSESALEKLHKEKRGNFYFIGEIHAFHPDLIPNSRRDYFNDNDISKLLDKKLKELFHCKFYPLYHDANELKNAVKKIESFRFLREDYTDKINNGSFSSKHEEISLIEEIEKAKKDVSFAKKKINRFTEKKSSNPTLFKIFERIVGTEPVIDSISIDNNYLETINNKYKYRTQKLSKLSIKEEKIVRKVFEIIDLMLPDLKDRGEELKCKIEEEFK